MKNIKVLTALSALLASFSLTGCVFSQTSTLSDSSALTDLQSSSVHSERPPVDSGLYTSAGAFPIVKTPIRLTIFAPADGENSRDENALTKELEEMTNIDIVWQIASNGAFHEKMNLMFASGELADVIACGPSGKNRISKEMELHLGDQGFIIPLEELVNSVSLGYAKAFEDLPGLRSYITTPEGHIYTLPNVDGSLHIQFNQKLWLNVTWLARLGMEMPSTVDELHDVLRAFQEQDANGSGSSEDEIPLSTCKGGTGTELDGFLMNPFQLTPESKLYLENGQVVFSPVTDGYREGLAYLRALYAEGLISPDSFTQDANAQVKLNEGGDFPVIGAFLAQRPGYACDLSTYPDNSRRWEQYRSVPPLSGPDETARSAWNPYAMYQTGVWAITSACQYPEAAFRLVDWLATEEGTLRTSEGPEGVGWRYAQEGELDLNGGQALIVPLEPKPENSGWGQLCGLVRTPELLSGYAVPQNPYSEGVSPLAGRNIVLYQASLEHQEAAQPFESVLPDLYFPESEIEEFTVLKTTLLEYASQSLQDFITGAKDLDREWELYIRQMESIGLSEFLSVVQDAFDSSAFA